MLGPCAGGAAYSPALTDFVFMVRETSQMFITGPDVVKAVTGEEITQNGLGGADVHAETSGVAHFAYDDEETCIAEVRYLLVDAPVEQPREPARRREPTTRPTGARDVLLDLVPADGNRPYDMHKVIEELVDDGDYLEIHERWARNIICALARLDGQVVGIVANQPQSLAGVLDIEASEKAARFVQMCDAFNIPIVTLLDVPGFLPGVDQEHGGIIRHGAKLLYAYCNATVPRISLILRKAYGGAYIVMDSQSIGADLTYAWPTNEIAVMGAEGAANVIFRRQIADAEDPEAMRVRMVKEYKAELMHPYYAAERGLVDDVIDPAETREVLIALPRDAPHQARRPAVPQARQPPAVTAAVTTPRSPPRTATETTSMSTLLPIRAARREGPRRARGAGRHHRDPARPRRRRPRRRPGPPRPHPRPAGAAWSAPRASAPRTAGRADEHGPSQDGPAARERPRTPSGVRGLFVLAAGAYRRRAISACSTSVMSALLASARWRASVVMIGVSGPICRASRTSSGVYGWCPSKPLRAMTNGSPLFSK